MRPTRLRSGFWRLFELRRRLAGYGAASRDADELIPRSQVWRNLEKGCPDIHNWTAHHAGNFIGMLGVWHVLVLAAITLLLFGGHGKISDLMGDVARGIKSFHVGLNDTDNDLSQSRAIMGGRKVGETAAELSTIRRSPRRSRLVPRVGETVTEIHLLLWPGSTLPPRLPQ